MAPSSASTVRFIENVGQFDEQVRYQVHGVGGAVFLAADALWVTLLEGLPEDAFGRGGLDFPDILAADRPRAGVNLRLAFEGANPSPTIEGFDPLDTTVSYFIGDDPARWRGDVPVWGGVRYLDLYPGVNLEITSEGGEWTWRVVASRAAFHSLLTEREGGLRLRVEGAERLRLVDGQLRITTDVRDLTLPLLGAVTSGGTPLPHDGRTPTLYGAGVEHPFVTSEPRSGSESNQQLTLGGSGLPGFGAGVLASPVPTAGQPLAPALTPGPGGLVYSTYLGGSQFEYAGDIAIDASGAAYAAGFTTSANFPASAGAFQTTYAGNEDAMVAKLTPDGTTLAYATYLGGSSGERAFGIAVDGTGSAFITGQTSSSNFPASGAFQGTAPGNGDAFISKLAANGTALVYSTYLGGTAADRARGIAVDGAGAAYVTGRTDSTDFPTVGAFQATLTGGRNAFISKVSPSGGSLIYSTYLGGQWEEGVDIAVDAGGAAYVTGYAGANFPTTAGALQPSLAASCTPGANYNDAFVAKLNAQGNGLAYATYLGGCHNENGMGLAVDPTGSAYVVGDTCSPDFPVTPGAFQTSRAGPGSDCDGSLGPKAYWDAFVVKLDATGSSLAYGTYLGGSYDDNAGDIAIDAMGSAHVTGTTASTDFPTTIGALQGTAHTNNGDAFVTKLAADGTGLLYSTYLGGSVLACQTTCYIEFGDGIKVDASGAAYVVGVTPESDFPVTAGSFQSSLSGESDGFVTKFDLSGAILPDDMVRSCGAIKSGPGGPAAADAGECPLSGGNDTQGVAGDPINTRAGGFDYSLADLTVPTAAGPLVFQRSY
ncbi:MAG: SBBP repeat-containing protein, partial [Anaerolineales bacterium]